MLADQLDYVVGVDPHRDEHAVGGRRGAQRRGGVRDDRGRRQRRLRGGAAARRAARARSAGVRGRGHGSYGAGLTRFLTGRGERVFEVGRLRRERRSGGKTDALDAVRAARSVLAQKRPATPRSSGEREALRALMAAREGAVNAKRAGLCQLRDLLVTTPEPLRGRAAAADPGTAARTPRRDPARAPTGPRAARQPARAALRRPPRASS